MLNRITVMGRLVRDPELRRTQNGIPVASFSVACERDFKDASGGKRRSAEILASSVSFGDSRPKNQAAPSAT